MINEKGLIHAIRANAYPIEYGGNNRDKGLTVADIISTIDTYAENCKQFDDSTSKMYMETLNSILLDYNSLVEKMSKDFAIMQYEEEHPDIHTTFKSLSRERNAVAWALDMVKGEDDNEI